MQRWLHDLSHQNHTCGEIGRLQTLSLIPIIAGDSIELKLEGIWRLSQLRRNLTMDAKVDLFVFFTPYRHVYGQDWIDFVQKGLDEDVTFTGLNIQGGATNFGSYLGGYFKDTIPRWVLTGYNRIWNRYFRVPSDTAGELLDTSSISPSDARGRAFGQPCAHLKKIYLTGHNITTDASDRQVGAVSTLDLLDLAAIQARYKTEQQRDWFQRRYSDVLKGTWGSGANPDADERPTLCMRRTFWLSGYDVDGTDDASLGQYSGKSAALGGIIMPRKYFPEHGTLRVMALVRFPTIHEGETHYLDYKVNPTYEEIAGDPEVIANMPPVEINTGDHIWGGSGTLGYMPYAQWYREHRDNVHYNFNSITGYPFIEGNFASKESIWYINPVQYDKVFQTMQLGHWQGHMNVTCIGNRRIPGGRASIFAGT